MCEHCNAVREIVISVLFAHDAQMKQLGLSKGGWEGWMQQEVVFALYNSGNYGPIAREIPIYTNAPRQKVDVLAGWNGRLEANEARGTLGIELKCQGVYEPRANFVGRVRDDRAKVGSAVTLGGFPVVCIAVWLNSPQSGRDELKHLETGDNTYGEHWVVVSYHGG